MKRRYPNTKANRELEADWEKLQRKWAKQPKYARMLHEEDQEELLTLKQSGPVRGLSKTVKSLSTAGGSAVKRANPVYTGTNVVGVATMHKSNMVPVFSTSEAADIASMRR